MDAAVSPPNSLPAENATVTALIDAAQELVQSRGYNAFSYRDLAARIGIKTSSIHYYFPTKGDLALAIVARYRTRFRGALERIEAENGAPAATLDAYLALICDTFAADSLICVCGMLATDAASLPDAARQEVRGFFADNEQWLTRLLARGRESGDFHFAAAPEHVASALFASMQGSMLSASALGENGRLREVAAWFRATLGA